MAALSLPQINSILFWSAIPLLVIAAFVVNFSWFPPRRGKDPHCRKCGYETIGNTSGRCSECGADLTLPRSIVHGTRRRRLVRGMVGVFIALLGLAVLLPEVRLSVIRFDRLTLYPEPWLIRDSYAGSDNAAKRRALEELQRRRAKGELSAAAYDELIETLIKVTAVTQPSNALGRSDPAFDLLAAQFAAGTLSPDQHDRFLNEILEFSFESRPRVTVGKSLPWEITYRLRGPQSTFWPATIRTTSFTIDGRTFRQTGMAASSESIGRAGRHSHREASAVPAQPGVYPVRVEALFTLTLAGRSKPYKRKLVYETSVEVLPAGSAEVLVKEVDDPAMLEVLRPLLKPRHLALTLPDKKMAMGMVQMEAVPVDLAFDAFLRIDGTEYPAGSLTLQRGTKPRITGFGGPIPPGPPPKKADVIFRSSVNAARQAAGISEIWKGELVYEDQPVIDMKRGRSMSSTSPTTQPGRRPTSQPAK